MYNVELVKYDIGDIVQAAYEAADRFVTALGTIPKDKAERI